MDSCYAGKAPHLTGPCCLHYATYITHCFHEIYPLSYRMLFSVLGGAVQLGLPLNGIKADYVNLSSRPIGTCPAPTAYSRSEQLFEAIFTGSNLRCCDFKGADFLARI